MTMILAYPQAQALLAARRSGVSAAETSLDLGRSTVTATLDDAGAHLAGVSISWPVLEEIAVNDVNCFQLEVDAAGAVTAEKIVRFSEESNRVYSLMPTRSAPTMLISGIPMHRIKGTDPLRDTGEKIRAVGRIHGQVLDTSMGLGYTAIAAAEFAANVTTIEIEPTVVDLCRLNPWSRELFSAPNITRLLGDSYELVQEFDAGAFDVIIHDPPAFGIDGELYSAAVYREFMRILRPRGRLFHYIGNPESKSGKTVTRGVIRRLQECGFTRVSPRPAAFGVAAVRP